MFSYLLLQGLSGGLMSLSFCPLDYVHYSHHAIPELDLGRPNLTDVRYGATADYYWSFDPVVNILDCFRGENLTSSVFFADPTPLDPYSPTAPACKFPNYGSEGSFFNWDDDQVYQESGMGKQGQGLELDAELGMCHMMGNFTVEDHQCLLEPTVCLHGFSLAFWVNMTWEDFTNGSISTFVSTGPDDDTAGFKIFQDGFYTKAEVRNDSVTWKAQVFRQLSWNNWTNIGIRWNSSEGLHLHIDGLEAASDSVGSLNSFPYPLNGSDDLLLGCRTLQNTSGGSPQQLDHASALIDEFAMWRWRLRDEERPFFVGGHVSRPGQLYEPPPVTVTEGPATTEAEFFTFDYTVDIEEANIPGNPDLNPFYTNAASYWPLTKTSLDAIVDKLGVGTYPGRAGEGIYHALISNRAYVKLGNYNIKCWGDLSLCPEGLSMSMWIQLPSVIPSTPAIILTSGTSHSGLVIYAMNDHVIISVANSGKMQNATVSKDSFKLARWTNLAFSWHPDTSKHHLCIFINGNVTSCASDIHSSDLSSLFSLCQTSPADMWLGCKAVSTDVTLEGVYLDDIVAWDRYLNSFEGHHFIGTTCMEKKRQDRVSLLWSTDYYSDRDYQSTLLRDFNPTYTTTYTRTQWVTSRDGKGHALKIVPHRRGWAMLGPSSQVEGSPLVGQFLGDGWCMIDPAACPDGFSLSMWIRVFDSAMSEAGEPQERAYILSSGEHNSKSVGMSMYLYEGKLGVAVADGIDYWKIIRDEATPLDAWLNIGFSWSRTQGIWLYYNGQLDTIDFKSLKLFRPININNRLTVGKKNDDFDFEVRAEFAFEDVGIINKYMVADEFRQQFGIPENRYYSRADKFWNRDELVSSSLHLLPSYKSTVGNFEITNDGIKLIVGPSVENAYIDLGSKHICPHNIALCTDGFSMSLWFKLHQGTNTPIFRSSLVESSNRVTLEMKNQKLVISMTFAAAGSPSSLTWQCTSSQTINSNKWQNLGFTWGQTSGLYVFIGSVRGCNDTSPVSQASLASPAHLVLGARQEDNVTDVNMEVTQLTMWNRELLSGHRGSLLGASEYTVQQYIINDHYWPFEEPFHSLSSPSHPELSEGGQLVADKIQHGIAWSTNAFSQSWINLGDFSGECITDPSLCVNRLTVGMWLMLEAKQSGYLFSSGAQQSRSTGIMVQQYMSDNIAIRVANGQKVWNYEIISPKISYTKWMHMRIIWQTSDGLKVYINNKFIGQIVNGFDYTASPLNTTVTLGKSNGEDTGYITASFDDVTISYDRDDMVISEAGCYETAMTSYALNQLEVPIWQTGLSSVDDRYKNTGSALRITDTTLDLGTILSSTSCPANPSVCNGGFSFSLWIKLPYQPEYTDDSYILSYGLPTNTGFSIRIGKQAMAQSDADSSSSSNDTVTEALPTQSSADSQPSILLCALDDGISHYEVALPLPTFGEWSNIGVTWSSVSGRGISAYVEGNLTANEAIATSVSTLVPANSHLVVGGTITTVSNLPGLILDDLAIWSVDLDTKARLSETLRGDTCPPQIVDPLMFSDTIYDIVTFTDSCPLRVNGTCLDNIAALHRYVFVEGVLNKQTIPIVIEVLYNETNPEDKPLKENLVMQCLKVFNHVCDAIQVEYKAVLDQQRATQEIKWLASSVSNLLFPVMYGEVWNKIQKVDHGLAEMVKKLEESALHIMKQTKLLDSQTSSGLQIDIHDENMFLQAKKFNYRKGHSGFSFPWMDHETMNETMGRWRGDLDRLVYPDDVFRDVTDNTENITVTVVSAIYDTLHHIFKSDMPLSLKQADETPYGKINGRIFSAAIHPKPKGGWLNHSSGIQINFYNKEEQEQDGETIHCMLWSFTEPSATGNQTGAWSEKGCKVKKTTPDMTTCTCNHMTTYGVLLKILPEPEPDIHEMPLKIITYIGIIVSIVTLVVFTFKVIGFKQRRRDIPAMLKNLAVCMIFLGLFVAISESAGKSRPILCQSMSILQHYLFAVCFGWIFMESLDALYTITTSISWGKLKIYFPIAWGLPLALVVALSVIKIDAYGVYPHCWIAYDEYYHYAMFGVNIAYLLSAAIVYLICVCNLFDPALKDEIILKHTQTAVRNNLILLPCLLLAWIFGLVSLKFPDIIELQYLTVIFYSFQGFLIVMAHVIGNPYFYVQNQEKYEEDSEEEESETEEPARPVSARSERPKTGQVAPTLYYKP